MSEDTFTEVTTESWLGRIGGAFKGIVVGLVLFIAAFPMLIFTAKELVSENIDFKCAAKLGREKAKAILNQINL